MIVAVLCLVACCCRGRGGRQSGPDPRLDPNIDPARAERILANRRSAAVCKVQTKLGQLVSPLEFGKEGKPVIQGHMCRRWVLSSWLADQTLDQLQHPAKRSLRPLSVPCEAVCLLPRTNKDCMYTLSISRPFYCLCCCTGGLSSLLTWCAAALDVVCYPYRQTQP
jgi:hypothetical protein